MGIVGMIPPEGFAYGSLQLSDVLRSDIGCVAFVAHGLHEQETGGCIDQQLEAVVALGVKR